MSKEVAEAKMKEAQAAAEEAQENEAQQQEEGQQEQNQQEAPETAEGERPEMPQGGPHGHGGPGMPPPPGHHGHGGPGMPPPLMGKPGEQAPQEGGNAENGEAVPETEAGTETVQA